MHVSLAEALEVRGGPLQEDEIWAILSQSVESLQELLRKGNTTRTSCVEDTRCNASACGPMWISRGYTADLAALGFIISPWSLLLLPSGNVSFTDENIAHQDIRAFTAPEILQGQSLSSLSDIEKIHIYSLGMTLFWGADYEVPQSQPMKLGEHLNSMLLNMCEDTVYTRVSVRTVLDACSAHIRNTNCEPSFCYVRKLVRLVLGSLTRLDGLLSIGDKEALPDRSREIRDRLRGKGLPSGRSTTPNAVKKHKARFDEQASLNRGLSKSMGFLAISNKPTEEEDCPPCTSSDYNSGHEDVVDESHQQGGKMGRMDKRPLYHNEDYGYSKKNWASSMALDYPDPEVVRHAGMDDRVTVRPKSASRAKEARHSDYGGVTGTLGPWKAHHLSELSVCSALSNAYDRIKDRQKKLHVLREAMDVDDPLKVHRRYHSDAYSTSSESPSVISSDPDYRQVRRLEDNRRYSSQVVLADHDVVSLASHVSLRHSMNRQYELPSEENLVSQEMMLKRQEQEMQRLQAQMAHRLSLYPGDLPRASMLDVTRDPLRDIALETTRRKLKNFFGPEFVKMTSEPPVTLDVPTSILTKKGKGEDLRRKVNILLLSGQKLELTCDTKSICKDVFDMVVAQIGLVEHHLFGLAYLKENEFFFVNPDLKLSKVAPEGWKDDPKKKKTVVNFNLFFRIKFFVDDVNLIQHTLTKHQYYLQLRRDILEERMRCDEETTLLLASLALQAEFGDYQPEVHGKTYFKLEHYLATTVLEKVDQSYIKEELPKLHSTYFGASEKETEFEFLKVCQKLPEYGVHFHRVLPEKKSQTGIMIGVCSKGVLIFEMHNGARTPVLRFPWRETKKISFTKKKISLQNTSDEIKHLFQTDSSKTCQYLLHLSSAQHKFYLQMKTRQNNQELQDIESSSQNHLNYHSDSAGVLPVGRAVSTVSLATSNISRPFDQLHPTQAESLKRTYCSELSLNKLLPGRPQSTVEPTTTSRVMMSKSYHNLSQVPESPEGRAPPYNSQSQSSLNRIHLAASMEGFRTLPSHHRARSDTESITVAGKPNNSKTLAGSRQSPGKRQLECDSSSFEDTGQAYVIGVSMHSSGMPSTPGPLNANETLKQKLNALPSAEREITRVNLKKDVKYSLGFQIAGGENTGRMDLGTLISSITPGGPADLDGHLKPGDRLLSVNNVSLEGVAHDAAVEILQNAPDDVTLVVSQPKERLYQEPSSATSHHKTRGHTRSPGKRQEHEEESSSEEHTRLQGHQRATSGASSAVSLSRRKGSVSSQDSRTESASLPQSHSNGFNRNQVADGFMPPPPPYHSERKVQAEILLPSGSKSRKVRSHESSKDLDYSDRGDSDMDEDTYSSSQEQQVLKESTMGKISGNAHPVNDLKPGDLFEVELPKKDNSLGISVTGGVNTSVRHGGIYVKAIIPKGAAELDARIKKGDRVLSVDGKRLDGATHKQAVETLRETGQVVHLLLERGQLPATSVHAPVTPQCTPPCKTDGQAEPGVKKETVTMTKDYSFVAEDNVFEVKLLKNTSGLGFSFCREENLPQEPVNPSVVRVKKLFPGQPAAESGRIEVGDVILRVNNTTLKGLSQHEVVSALRGTAQEVTLLLCRPKPGTLPNIDPSLLTPLASPRKDPQGKSDSSLSRNVLPQADLSDSSTEEEVNDEVDNGEFQRLQLKSPSRRDSYSDSTDNDEVGKAFSPPKEKSSEAQYPSVYQTPGNALVFPGSRYETPCTLEDTMRTVYYTPQLTSSKPVFNHSNPPSPVPPDQPEPEVPSPTPLDDNYISSSSGSQSPASLPHQDEGEVTSPLQHQYFNNVEEIGEFEPEVELHVSLVKSEKGSLGFTVTKGSDDISCYIHDIIQDPAKSDGRLRPGDRLIMVNNTDVTNMSHTEAVNFLRTTSKVVDLVLGRVLEIPKPPIELHMLPDITLQCQGGEELGLMLGGGSDSAYQVIYVADIVPGSFTSMEGSLRQLDLIHYINGVSTQELSLLESERLLELPLPTVVLKATRDGQPLIPAAKKFLSLNNNLSPKINGSTNVNGYPHGEDSSKSEGGVIHLELNKPATGGLGFSVVGGEKGFFVKSITPGGVADTTGDLQVGDKLLQVNGESMIGVSHTKAVTTIRKAKGLVQLSVSRAPPQSENPYLLMNAVKYNGNPDVGIDIDMEGSVVQFLLKDVQRGVQKRQTQNTENSSPDIFTADYASQLPEVMKSEEEALQSEDTDCDGLSLPEDSPEMSRRNGCRKDVIEVPAPNSSDKPPQQAPMGNPDEDEITWGSDELPIESLQQDPTEDGPIITEEELTSLPLVRVVPEGRFAGSKLKGVIRMLRGLLDQKVPLEEFENLQNLHPLDECLIGQTKENRKKNRYKNILPYDATRVCLGNHGGYINASFIKMLVKDEEFVYIACQGPLPNTLADFWQMVWEQKSNVIAMITQEVEGGKVKCQRYWPDTPSTPAMVDDRLQLTLLKHQHLDNFILRLIEVKDMQTGEIQHVTHLNFTGWPDHGTPSQPEQLLTFISYMRHIHQSGPIITHCSAGIGRSGTLICIDVILGLISKDVDFDISDVVRTMRLQRHGMIQTEEQYVFCYQVILYVLRCLQAEEKISG